IDVVHSVTADGNIIWGGHANAETAQVVNVVVQYVDIISIGNPNCHVKLGNIVVAYSNVARPSRCNSGTCRKSDNILGRVKGRGARQHSIDRCAASDR